MPAPKLALGASWLVNQVRRAGDITDTNGLRFSETCLADMGALIGNVGKSVRSSRSARPPLTRDGTGCNVSRSTAATELSRPLMISKVASRPVQANRVRGGSPRMATRKTSATRQSRGRKITSGLSASLAQHGTAGGNFGSRRTGASGGVPVSAISVLLITIFSMHWEVSWRQREGRLLGILPEIASRCWSSLWEARSDKN